MLRSPKTYPGPITMSTLEDSSLNVTVDRIANNELQEYVTMLQTVNAYVLANIRKNFRTFKIGMFSIFLVVTFIVSLQSLIELSPIILLKVAEDQQGHTDILLSPAPNARPTGYSSEFPIQFVNLTEARLKLEGMPNIAVISPRWIFPINVSALAAENQTYKAVGIMLDSPYERKRGVGWRLETKDLNEGECWVTKSLADTMQPESKLLYVETKPNIA